jgi:hypothetical protein
LLETPFKPFRIVTTSGAAFDVPAADHASVLPKLRVIHVADDRYAYDEIHAFHVSSIETLRRRKRSA